MWIPESAQEVEHAARGGHLDETASFDAKADLPPPKKNADLATDVAAMSTDGGVLLYGVAEDDNERPTIPQPIALAGAADRIGQIVATSIAEVPHIEFRELPCADDPSRGYLVVIVPQSPRAPHQVIVGGDLRFYGRGPKGNRRLTEGEVARLYERRQVWAVNRDALLAECIAAAPVEPHPTIGYVHAFARPVAADNALGERALAALGCEQGMFNALSQAASSSRIMSTFDPSLGHGGLRWQPQGADAWRGSRWLASEYSEANRKDHVTGLAEVELKVDGRGRMFCGRATDVIRDGKTVVMEVIIAGNVGAFFAMMNTYYRAAAYHGHVDVGVAVTNLRGAGSLRMRGAMHALSYGADTFTRTDRFGAAALGDHEQRTRDLLGRLFLATTGLDEYDPFADVQ